MTKDQAAPFADLPASLVEEVLQRASEVGDALCDALEHLKKGREDYRKALQSIVLHESSLGYPPFPTTCGIDGSYAIERLLTVDLVAAAAVAVEGLTPPSEERFWENPHHKTFIVSESHSAETSTILRAIMLGNELRLAVKAPHDLVLLDGTLTLPVIYFNQALNQVVKTPDLRCTHEFLDHCLEYLEAYRSLLFAQRSDKHHVGLPKYSTRREIGTSLGWPGEHDDRGLLTLLLQPGELTKPLALEQPSSEWHLNWKQIPASSEKAATLERDIVHGIKNISVFYYKPHAWLPAIRIEMAGGIAANKYRMGVVIQGIKHQCATAAMLEPYPLFLADRTVKALAKALPAFRQVATQRMSDRYEGDISEVFFTMHGYRSETGV